VYGKSIDVRFTPIRVVCNNTLTFALDSASQRAVKVGHRAQFNPDMVKEQLGIAHEKFAKYKEMAQFLGSKRFSVDSFWNITTKYSLLLLVKISKRPLQRKLSHVKQRTLLTYWIHSQVQSLQKVLGGRHSIVTYVTDHLQGRNADNRLHSQWYGQNQLRKIKAAEKQFNTLWLLKK
jgi:hypothetical protein